MPNETLLDFEEVIQEIKNKENQEEESSEKDQQIQDNQQIKISQEDVERLFSGKEDKINFKEDQSLEESNLEKEEAEKNEPQTDFLPVIKFLVEKNFFEIPEGQKIEDLSEQQIVHYYDTYFENEVQKGVFSLLEKELPQELLAINDYVINQGGSLADYFSKITQEDLFLDSLNIEDKDVQRSLYRSQLEQNKIPENVIDETLKNISEEKLKEQATALFENLKRQKQNKEKAIREEQQRKIQEQKENHLSFKMEITNLTNSLSEIEGFPITRKDREELPKYITENAFTLQDGRGVSSLQKDLYEVLNSPKKTILLAKILKDKFNFDDFKEKIQSNVTKNIKETLTNTNRNKILTTLTNKK